MKADELYDQVARELLEGRLVAGVWARALDESSGNADKAKAFYIRHRVEQLTKDLKAQQKAPHQQSDNVTPQESNRTKFDGPTLVIFGMALLLALIGYLIHLASPNGH